MQRNFLTIVFALIGACSFHLKAQYTKQDSTFKNCFIGSSLIVLANFVPDADSPDFAQLNLGYRLSKKDALSLELITWKYSWSLGIPFGENFDHPNEKFPGYIREFGVGIVYQRFWWKGLYSGIHVTNAWQSFVNEEGNKIDHGFQLFNTYRLGYHFRFFKDRFFVQPSIAITHRAYHTEMPQSFKQLDDKWSKFFFGEPGLHFGFNF